jgi:integrase
LRRRIKEVKTGKLFEYSNVKNMGRAFSRYLVDIELDAKGYVLTTFRKDFISRSQEAGVPVNAASLLAGHSKISTTMEYYTTLSSEFLRGELNKLD